MKKNVALIVAAGSGERFGGALPKQYMDLAGQPILRRSVQAFLNHPDISGVLVVINPAHGDLYEAAVGDLGLSAPARGGSSRQESVLNGLEALAAQAPDNVLIHDAARPLVDAPTISAVCQSLQTSPGAIAAKPLVDTLKRGQGIKITATIDRTNLWQAHTPQAFHYAPILAAHRAVRGAQLTDDAAVAEEAGIPVALVPSNPDNMKITNPDDLGRAARLLGQPMDDIRTGFGFDVHRLIPGTHTNLCGIKVPHTQQLEGHSDADVALHAVCDAIFGALADGDIGAHFPPSDPQWKGKDSAHFVHYAVNRVRQRGGVIAHIDVTLMCERPKIGPHRDAMRNRLAEMLEIDLSRIAVKATTTERLGFTGREEGIAAQAVATIRLPHV
ncbi:MAG: bifunctional 2-C-methyl-D-erythritol 4-phosphate cytidylyltransferase/2-C-methyl-D-erythritol 2,4-cyclodiphosphate synthase [Alphaproteobacteria bacterium]